MTVPKLSGEVPAANDPAVAPVPVSGTASEGFEASLVTVRVEFPAPLTVGANTTLKLMLAPAFRVIGRVAPFTLYAPPGVSALMWTVVPPELVNVSWSDLVVLF